MALGTGTMTAERLVAEINEVILRDPVAKTMGSVALDDAGGSGLHL